MRTKPRARDTKPGAGIRSFTTRVLFSVRAPTVAELIEGCPKEVTLSQHVGERLTKATKGVLEVVHTDTAIVLKHPGLIDGEDIVPKQKLKLLISEYEIMMHAS